MKLTKYKILHLSLQNIVRSIKDKKILQKEIVKNKNEIVKNKNVNILYNGEINKKEIL